MSYGRVAVAVGVGACGAGLASASVYALLYGLFSDFVPLPGAASEEDALDLFLVFFVAPILTIGGGSLISRMQGVRWWLRPLISLAAHVAGMLLWLLVYFFLSTYPSPDPVYDLPTSFFAMLYVFVVPFIMIPSILYDNATNDWRMTLTPTSAAIILLVVSLVFAGDFTAVCAGILAWVLLPALAVLDQIRRNRISG